MELSPFLIALLLFFVTLASAILFSLAEHSYSKLNAKDIRWLRAKNDKLSQQLLKMLRSGVNIVAAMEFWKLFFVVSFIFISNFTILLFSKQYLQTALPYLATFLIVFLICFVFIFLVPKIYADNHVLVVARAVTPYISPFEKIISPFVRIPRSKEYTPEIVQEENLTITAEERDLYKRVINFPYKTVRNILTPRVDIEGVSQDISMQELIKRINEYRHSRIPVYKGSMDNIIGILYAKDVLAYKDRENFYWRSLVLKPMLVSPDMQCNDLLDKFKSSRKHMAIVVDEFGGCMGLVTLEDAMEVVLGDIRDEYDKQDSYILKLDDKRYLVDARVTIEHLMDADPRLAQTFDGYESKNVETLNGYILEEYNKMPKAGDELHINSTILQIESMAKNIINKVKITLA